MIKLLFSFRGGDYQAKLIHSTRNGNHYYWVDILDKMLARKVGPSFTFMSNDDSALYTLTPVNNENKQLVSLFRSKILELIGELQSKHNSSEPIS